MMMSLRHCLIVSVVPDWRASVLTPRGGGIEKKNPPGLPTRAPLYALPYAIPNEMQIVEIES